MATSSSSTGDSEFELTSPGQRSGEGSGSVIPYLNESFATKPGELVGTGDYARRKPVSSLAGRLRRALGIKKRRK